MNKALKTVTCQILTVSSFKKLRFSRDVLLKDAKCNMCGNPGVKVDNAVCS